MLEFSVERGEKYAVNSSICLNDVVISSLGIAKLIRLQAKTEVAPGEFAEIGCYRSDGLIIATPTGSTAYSLAAGGPILDPEMEAQIISPICPFTMSNRPLVLPSRQALQITVCMDQRSGVLLTCDGQETFALEPGDLVTIKHSPHYALLVTAGYASYYKALAEKLAWSSERGLASSQPDRITSVSGLAPIRKPSEPTIIDLPAPVSPVSTLKPGRKEREMESTRAKFLIVSSSSICAPFGEPCQFFRQRFVVRRIPGGNQNRVMGRMFYGD